MTSSEQHAARIASLEGRLEGVRADLEAREADVKAIRAQISQGIAEGKREPALKDLRAAAREASEDAADLRRAIPVLTDAIEAARQDLEAARRNEAGAEAQRLVAKGVQAVNALDSKAREVLAELLPLADRADAASSAATAAERAADKLVGPAVSGTTLGTVTRDGWRRCRGLRELIEFARLYEKGGDPLEYRLQRDRKAVGAR